MSHELSNEVVVVPHNHHSHIIHKLDGFFFSNKIPHIIFHGSSGSGKRTLIYDFLNKVYDNDKHKLKTNVMIVNCSHCKGIKFIREELKFFAKSNMQANNGKLFKSIVLLNADSLTIDAQSALRRCIELFSHTTRFFLVVENKDKLLNPICSRFCEIYVPEFVKDGKIRNLHTVATNSSVRRSIPDDIMERIQRADTNNNNPNNNIHMTLIEITERLYNEGYSTLDLIHSIKESGWPKFNVADIVMKFEQVKSEFRSEKLLMFYLLVVGRETYGFPYDPFPTTNCL